jgi:hypothetical protein
LKRWTLDNAVEGTNGAGDVLGIKQVETPVDGDVVRLSITLLQHLVRGHVLQR